MSLGGKRLGRFSTNLYYFKNSDLRNNSKNKFVKENEEPLKYFENISFSK
jgi:hypothetical protein